MTHSNWSRPLKRLKKNKGALFGLGLIIFFLIIGLFSPLLAPYSPTEIFTENLLKRPFESQFLFGTDDVGRDLLSRLIHGARLSLFIGFFVVIISASIGSFLGLISGYYWGWVDRVIIRMTDILMSLPSILLAIVVVSVLGPGLVNAVIAVSIVSIPGFVRLIRSSVINEKNKDYVQAAKSLGASNLRILFINIFPNCLAPLIVQATFGFSEGILSAAALGFLGLGAQAPTAEWGTMLADARSYIVSAPHLVFLPGSCILLLVLGFNLFGDGLRDALDPKM